MSSYRFPLLLAILVLLAGTASAQQYSPAIMHSALLNKVELKSDTGWFHIEGMQAVFLPDPVRKSKSIYAYNPRDGGKLDARLTRADGSLVATFHFYAEKRKPPYWLLNSNELEGGGSRSGFRLTRPGSYVLEFSIEGKPFQRFAFSVWAGAGTDPYHPSPTYVLNGDWNRYGYLYYADAVPERPLQFKLWLRSLGSSHSRSATVQLLDSSGRVLAHSQAGTSYSLHPEWVRYEFTLRTKRTFFPASDLLKKDGSYSIRVRLDDQIYGIYPFKVSGHHILRQGRQAPSYRSLDRIEGGADAWWLEKI